uniref:thiosulfate sulfurtransferase GlpE n=1 Tax=uncultured Spongiibacter sp. TaxID=870896 RepID=UPI0025827287
MSFKRISISDAEQLLRQPSTQLADIRDEQSYQLGHIKGASHLDNHNLQQFIEDADPDAPLIIYCYHGNSSQSAADWLSEQGFSDVVSLDGGYEVLRQ